MWRVYKHRGKDTDYEVYKEALNAATSKHNVRDKVGPLDGNAGNIITQGMAE